jgi:hypothetical protein
MKKKIIARLKEKRDSLKVPHNELSYYDIIEAEISLLEEILLVDYKMTHKEVKEL